MVIFDFIVVIFIAGLGLLGFKRGFIKELVETVGAILAALLAYHNYEQFAKLIGIVSTSVLTGKLGAFFGLFILIMLILSILGHILRKFLRSINLGLYERLAGFALGTIKGGIIMSVLTLALIWTGDSGEEIVTRSKYARANLLIFDLLAKALPESIQNKYDNIVGSINISSSHVEPLPVIFEYGLEDHRGIPNVGRISDYDRVGGKGLLDYEYDNHKYVIEMFKQSIIDTSLSRLNEIKGTPVMFEIGFDPTTQKTFAVRVRRMNANHNPDSIQSIE